MHFRALSSNYFGFRMLLPMALLLGLLIPIGCSDEQSPEKMTSTGNDQAGVSVPPSYGPRTLEERILSADVIAVVELDSVNPAAIHRRFNDGFGDLREYWESGLKFTFAAKEFLKRTGDNQLVAVVGYEEEHDSEQAALDAANGLPDLRDTQWDERDAIVFLFQGTTTGVKNYPYVFTGARAPSQESYAIDSKYNKAWLPAARVLVGASGTDRHFLLDAHSQGPQGVSGASGSQPPPTIALSDLRSRITEMKNLVDAGSDSDDYTAEDYGICLQLKYELKRFIKWRKEQGIFPSRFGFQIDSGLPARTAIETAAMSGGTRKGVYWLEGQDKKLFFVEAVGVTEHGPETARYVQYAVAFGTSRPLPSGDYSVYYNAQQWLASICDGYDDEMRTATEWAVEVDAPVDTIHEAFFDPIDIGDAVGADGSNGVLKPTTFSLTQGGGTASLGKIAWESGRASIELDTSVSLAGHHVDFIVLGGSVALRLDFDDASATTEGSRRTLTWNACKQPWESGDLLMLRMSRSGEGLTGVTNDGPCNRPPTFDASSYSFSVAEDAATSTAVGTVSATDSDEGDTVSYSITAGNDAGKFAIGSSNGQITVAGTLDYEAASSYTLTVEASDGGGGTASTPVTIAVTDVNENQPPSQNES